LRECTTGVDLQAQCVSDGRWRAIFVDVQISNSSSDLQQANK